MSVSVLMSLVDASILNELTPDEVEQVTKVLVGEIESDPPMKQRLTHAVEESAQQMLANRTATRS